MTKTFTVDELDCSVRFATSSGNLIPNEPVFLNNYSGGKVFYLPINPSEPPLCNDGTLYSIELTGQCATTFNNEWKFVYSIPWLSRGSASQLVVDASAATECPETYSGRVN